jgi:hypothetical protein
MKQPPLCNLPPPPHHHHHTHKPQYATLLTPIEPRTKSGARRLAELAAGHQRFCANQLANKKTSRVLEVAFGAELTTQYMEGLMFDFNPGDSPPWFDTSISRLYHHFDENPEPWKDGEQLLSIRQALDVDKAQQFLERWVVMRRWDPGRRFAACFLGCTRRPTRPPAPRTRLPLTPQYPAPPPTHPPPPPARFLEGEDSIAGERLQFALATMYDADEEFREAVNAAAPDLAALRLEGSGEVGRRLEEQLLELVGAARQQGAAAAAAAAAAPEAASASGQQQPEAAAGTGAGSG